MGALQQYTYPAWGDLARNGGTNAKLVAKSSPMHYQGFSVREVDGGAAIASLPELAGFPNPITCTPKVFQWGYPGVTSATCRIYIIRLATAQASGDIYVGNGLIPFSRAVVVGTKTPPPNSLCAGGSGCPASESLTFRNPLASAQLGSVSEANYGTRSTNPAQVYTLSAPSCAGNVTVASVGNGSQALVPTNNGSGYASFPVAPVKKVEPTGVNCTASTLDNMGQVAGFPIVVGNTFAPSAFAPNTSGGAGATIAVSAQERNYDSAAEGGSFSASASGSACGTLGAPSDAMSSDGLYTLTQTRSLRFAARGVCTVSFVDAYGQDVVATPVDFVTEVAPVAVRLPMPGDALPALTIGGTTYLACGVGDPRAFTDSSFGTPDPAYYKGSGCFNGTFTVTEPGYSGAFSVSGASACPAVTLNGSGSGPSATYTLSANTPTSSTCALTFSDSVGGTKAILFVQVQAPPPSVWPPAVQYPVAGQALAAFTHGGKSYDACATDQPRAFEGSGFQVPEVNQHDPWWGNGSDIQTDANGCEQDEAGNALDMTAATNPHDQSALVYESGYTGAFDVINNTCETALVQGTPAWNPNYKGPGPDGAAMVGEQPIATCSFSLGSGTNVATVAAQVVLANCNVLSNSTTPDGKPLEIIYLPSGATCGPFGNADFAQSAACSDISQGATGHTDGYFTGIVQSEPANPATGWSMTQVPINNVTGADGSMTVTRTTATDPIFISYQQSDSIAVGEIGVGSGCHIEADGITTLNLFEFVATP